jgi:hypothetical protein
MHFLEKQRKILECQMEVLRQANQCGM